MVKVKQARWRGMRRVAGAALATVGVAAVAAGSASAAPTGIYAPFVQCPTGMPGPLTPGLASCLYDETTSGSFKLGSVEVPINKTIVLQGGLSAPDDTTPTPMFDALNGQTLSRTALKVPKGLAGVVAPWLVPSWLEPWIDWANGVEATAELVGTPKFAFNNFVAADGTTFELPLRVKLSNTFLGNNCYIGSSSDPLVLKLTAGTTTPPAGYTPMVGTTGTLRFQDRARHITATGRSLVDNNFRAPKAHGCGGIFSWAVDPILNLTVGLPANPGVSEARLTGTAQIGAATAVRNSDVP